MPLTTLLVRALVVAGLVAAVAPVNAQSVPPATKSGKEFYMAYRVAMEKAKSMEDILPWVAKDVRAQMEATPQEDRAMMFGMMQDLIGPASGVRVVDERKTDEGIELSVESTEAEAPKRSKGTVRLVFEDGALRLVKESWGGGS